MGLSRSKCGDSGVIGMQSYHRKPKHPATFGESNRLLQHLILTRPQLLITAHYSHDTKELCPRCEPTAAFRLADPNLIVALLGYC
jgi:hypothetical protein